MRNGGVDAFAVVAAEDVTGMARMAGDAAGDMVASA